MWFLLIWSQILAIQGLNRVVLRGSNSPCTGRLEVYHDQKHQWGLVHHYGWNRANGEVVCKSLGCGALVHTDVEMTLYKDPPPPKRYLMDQVKCSSEEESLWNCPYVGTNMDIEQGFVAVECAGNVTLRLNMNGQTDKCAGVVQFSTQNEDISVCNSHWDEEKANKICQELNCGRHYYIPKSGIFEAQQSKHQGLMKCDGNESFSWQCMEWPVNCMDDASVICTKHVRFRLQGGGNLCSGFVEEYSVTKKSWVRLQQTDVTPETICAQLDCGIRGNFTNQTNSLHLTCSGNVKLRNFTSVCFGPVYVVVNESERGVCYSNTLSRELGMVVCRELRCGDVLDVKQGNKINNGLLSNVECDGNETSLWHCLAKHKNTECHSTTVTCAGTLDVRLSDGFGRCSGRVEVNLEGFWRSFRSGPWTTENSDVVCKHLGCGNSTKMTRKLFLDENQVDIHWQVKCKSSSAKLHECLHKTTTDLLVSNHETAQIICQKEEFMFFKGDRPCQGRVGIESFEGQTRWLAVESVSQSNKTASDACKAMQCGSLTSVRRDQNTIHAIVKCSGSVDVMLLNPREDRCWGTVNVCRGDGCGGICKKTWTEEDSRMLCNNLGCGDPIMGQLPSKTQMNLQVMHYSVYCSKKVKNLNMCNFISYKNFICRDPASVICTDSVKAKLEGPRDKCTGKVLLFYAGEWTPVCKNTLDKNLQNTICKTLDCGEAESAAVTLDGESETQGLSEIKCSQDADSVVKCKLTNMKKKSCTAGYLKCSGWTRLFLYQMEGVCSGPVSALSSHQPPQLVSIQGWTREEGQVLCQNLQCGNYISHFGKAQETSEWWNKTYNCSGKKNIWDCESDSQTVQPQQLNIRCDGKPPEFTLSNPCTGQVLVNKMPVCASGWDQQMSHVLCNNLKCGYAIDHWQSRVFSESAGWYFSCTGLETSLWQCSSMRGTCDNIISVACQNSVKFSTTKKCRGLLKVQYQDQQAYVCGGPNETNAMNVCEALGCKSDQTQLYTREISIANTKQVSITCPEPYQNLSQCVQLLKGTRECEHGWADISCEGYEESNLLYGVLVLGLTLGFLGLLVLIMINQKKRLLSVLRRYRNKNVKDVNLNRSEMNNMETVDKDSSEREMTSFDDYEDVDTAKTNPQREDDAGSDGTEYDDIEERVNNVSHPQTHTDDDLVLPLLPERPENLPADQVTYEVEINTQEDYDDVIPEEALANENAGIPVIDTPAHADVIMGAGANTDSVEVEVHVQPE